MRRFTLFSLCGVFSLALAVSATAAEKNADHASRNVWPPETLTGTIMLVEPNQNLVVVKGADNVPFDMHITPSTSIREGNRAVNSANLSADTNRQVSVTFVPTGSGDMARSIRITG